MLISRRVILLGLPAVLMVGLTALTGCATGERPSFDDDAAAAPPLRAADGPPGTLTSVGIVGDSITAAAADSLRWVLTARGITDITIDAESKRRIEVGNGTTEPPSGVKALYQLLASGAQPDAWVIALGTNDVGSYPDPDAYAALVDRVLDMLPSTTPIVWVDVYLPDSLADSQVFDLVLRERLQARGNAVVAPWYATASQPNADLLSSDGVHPNAAGLTVFATVIADALAQLP